MVVVSSFYWHTVLDVDTQFGQGIHFHRVIGHQPNRADLEMRKHIPTHRVIPEVCIKAEALIRFNRISPGILELIGSDFIDQANASAFLPEVE